MKEYVWGGATIILTLLLVFTVTILDDRIIVDLPSEQCEKGLTLIIHNDYTKLKCGYNVVGEWKEYVDYYRTYGEPDRWVNDYRKRTLIKLKVLDYSPTHFVVRKIVPYYKGRTGTDGVLYIDYVFTTDRVKWSYTFNHSNTAIHRVRLKMLRFEDDYGYNFLYNDTLYYNMVDNEYYYGGVKGNLFIDPEIQVMNKMDVVKRCHVEIIKEEIKEPVYTTTTVEYYHNDTTAIIKSFVGYDVSIVETEVSVCKEYINYNTEDTDFLLQKYNCKKEKNEIICDSCIDGDCNGVCFVNGGETCCKPEKDICKNSIVPWENNKIFVDRLKVSK